MQGRLTVFDDSVGPVADLTECPVWGDVAEGLERVYRNGGYVKLEVLEPEDSIIERLTMVALPGMFRLYLNQKSEERRKRIYEWWEPGDGEFRGLRTIDDDQVDARKICMDIAVANSAFHELLETGGLAASISEMRSYWNPRPRD